VQGKKPCINPLHKNIIGQNFAAGRSAKKLIVRQQPFRCKPQNSIAPKLTVAFFQLSVHVWLNSTTTA
jgi:hypothetical protein